jgi:septal ring factor EnvC (AmiA/AmiB activator)
MTIHTDRIVLVFPIAAKNRQAAASLQTLEITESGKEFETLVPLDPVLVSQYASEFNLPLIAELAEVQADLATATTQLEATTQAKTTLEAQVATLEEEKQELRGDIVDLDQALDTEQQLTAALKAKIADLEQYRPFNPRILKGEAFYNRVSKEDMVTLLASDDATLVTVGKTIEAYRAHHWPVVLDSQDFQQLVGYVLQSGVFDGEEVTAIMRDATREEAYSA